LCEDGVEIIEQQCFVGDSKRFYLIAGLPMARNLSDRALY
jgi:hypothetical protein